MPTGSKDVFYFRLQPLIYSHNILYDQHQDWYRYQGYSYKVYDEAQLNHLCDWYVTRSIYYCVRRC